MGARQASRCSGQEEGLARPTLTAVCSSPSQPPSSPLPLFRPQPVSSSSAFSLRGLSHPSVISCSALGAGGPEPTKKEFLGGGLGCHGADPQSHQRGRGRGALGTPVPKEDNLDGETLLPKAQRSWPDAEAGRAFWAEGRAWAASERPVLFTSKAAQVPF